MMNRFGNKHNIPYNYRKMDLNLPSPVYNQRRRDVIIDPKHIKSPIKNKNFYME